MTTGLPLLFETQALCKHYRTGTRGEVRALDEVTLGIASGSLTLVSGPSGSGKTTLLAILGALDRPTQGRVLFEGKDLSRCSDAELARVRRRMGFIFQDFALIPNLTAEENVTYPLIPRGIPALERCQRAREVLGRFGMEDRLNARARELSGGEQQRVAIARALAGQPDVILADEPTSNLDADITGQVLALFSRLHAEGKTLVLSSHDPRLLSLATCVFEVQRGKVHESGIRGQESGVRSQE